MKTPHLSQLKLFFEELLTFSLQVSVGCGLLDSFIFETEERNFHT